MDKTFIIDTKLNNDSYHVVNLAFTQVRLSKKADFPWLILVPFCGEYHEIFDIEADIYPKVMKEWRDMARISKDYFKADKINIAAYGNIVSQLHLHIIARYKDDPAWPNPIWNILKNPQFYSEAAALKIIDDLTKLCKML